MPSFEFSPLKAYQELGMTNKFVVMSIVQICSHFNR